MKRRLKVTKKVMVYAGIVTVIGIGAAVVLASKNGSSRANNTPGKNLQYMSQRYAIGLERRLSAEQKADYYLTIQFIDSYSPKSRCPMIQPGFKGNITVDGITSDSARFTITQNKAPYKGASEIDKTAPCPAIAIVPVAQTYKLDSAWLEAGSATKKVTIQDVDYSLVLDKQAFALRLNGPQTSIAVAYIPGNVVALFSYAKSNCTAQQVRDFASAQGIKLAEQEYPNITTQLASSGFQLAANNQTSVLVINDDTVKGLQSRPPDGSECQVFVGTELNFGLNPKVISVGE